MHARHPAGFAKSASVNLTEEALGGGADAATLEAAKVEFEASWGAWKAWAKLKEVP